MRILHIVNDARTGGAQTLIEALASSSRSLGSTMALCVLMDEDVLSPRFESVMDEVHYLRLRRDDINPISAIKQLRAIVRSWSPDILHSHLLQSDLMALLVDKRVPWVSTVHTSGFSKSDPKRSRVLARVIARTSGRMDAAVACSAASSSYMEMVNYRAPRVTLIQNGVTLPPEPNFSAEPAEAQFVCLSRWHPMKDHATLFEAFKILVSTHPAAYLFCAGSGMSVDNADLVNLLSSIGIRQNVHLLGPVDDVGPLLSSSVASIISSRYGEGLPMAGIESLSRGTPVITTDVGSCRDVSIEPGYVCTPGDARALAEAMRSSCEKSASEQRNARVRARQLCESVFDVRLASHAYHALYQEIISGHAKGQSQ